MPYGPNTGRLINIRDIFGQMPDKEERMMLLQAEAYEKYGQTGEDIAVDLLTDHPELILSEEEFWEKLKAELED